MGRWSSSAGGELGCGCSWNCTGDFQLRGRKSSKKYVSENYMPFVFSRFEVLNIAALPAVLCLVKRKR
jgi:hypothetical protein